ncbi:hypothetical protein ACFSQ7_24355 [Paenibacillus rhizoplanae]
MKLIKDYLQANFTGQVTLEQLEQEAGISRFHLIRLFKKGAICPPHAYQKPASHQSCQNPAGEAASDR